MVKRARESPFVLTLSAVHHWLQEQGSKISLPALTLSFKPLSLKPLSRRLLARSPRD